MINNLIKYVHVYVHVHVYVLLIHVYGAHCAAAFAYVRESLQ